MGGVWSPQWDGSRVGLMLSNEEIATPPNSEAYVPGHCGPVRAGCPIEGGVLRSKGCSEPPELSDLLV